METLKLFFYLITPLWLLYYVPVMVYVFFKRPDLKPDPIGIIISVVLTAASVAFYFN